MRLYAPKGRGQYKLPPEIYRLAVQWCRCYPVWVRELETPPDTSKAITYDQDKVQTSGGYDATAELAIRRMELAKKVRLINDVAKMTTPDLYTWLLKGVTENYTADQLIAQGMPCSKNLYYRKRYIFYYKLAKRI
jgi:hypothetical protein